MNTDHDLVTMQDFIVGRLSDGERQAFEDRLVHEPELARELEQSLRMREGFRQLRAQGYFTKAPSRRGRFRIWAPILAAAAAAGLALFLWLLRAAGPSPILMRSLGSPAVTDLAAVSVHFTFVAVRGSSVPDLDLPPAGLIEIRVAPTTRETDHSYRVTLVRQEGEGSAEPVAGLTGLALSTDGYVHCFADASRLTPGSYVLRMQPDGDTSSIAEAFPFNLRSRGGSGSSR
jgi:hypothetical protein